MAVEHEKTNSKQQVSPTLNTYEKSDLQRIVNEHANSISVMDNKGNVLMVFMGVAVANFVGTNIVEINKRGVYNWSPCFKAIETGKAVLGEVESNYGSGQIVASTPLMDENGAVVMVVDVALDKKLMDKYLAAIKAGKNMDDLYKTTVGYFSSGDAFPQTPVSESPQMRQIITTCNTIAKTDSSIMLTGESGTGKEVMARYIHRNSLRSHEAFIPVNCAAIPHELMESEFFGYVKGAFTGANTQGKPGLFEMADKGTLFLDEIGELPLDMQSKLLRVLESGEIKNVGGTTIKHTDVRLISATNRDLKEMMSQKLFRDDVYYRLSVIPVNVPPLRERPEDIRAISNRFLMAINTKYNSCKTFSKETMQAFYEYDWPGNVRELRNVIERLAVTSIGDELHFEVDSLVNSQTPLKTLEYMPEVNTIYKETLKDFMDRVEAEYIEKVLAESNGRVCEAAKRLGIHRTMIYRKMKTKLKSYII